MQEVGWCGVVREGVGGWVGVWVSGRALRARARLLLLLGALEEGRENGDTG